MTRRPLSKLKRGDRVADVVKAGVVSFVRPAAAGATRVDFTDGTHLQGPSTFQINVLGGE